MTIRINSSRGSDALEQLQLKKYSSISLDSQLFIDKCDYAVISNIFRRFDGGVWSYYIVFLILS